MITQINHHLARTETARQSSPRQGPKMTDTTEPEKPLHEITPEFEELARVTAAAASKPAQNALRYILALLLVGGGGSGVFVYSGEARDNQQDEQIQANSKAAEANAKAAKHNGTTIRRIAVLLVQQGRYVEDMVRDVADGKPIRKRPPELGTIERQILSESDD